MTARARDLTRAAWPLALASGRTEGARRAAGLLDLIPGRDVRLGGEVDAAGAAEDRQQREEDGEKAVHGGAGWWLGHG